MLRTLGIETSCDDSAVAVLDRDGRVEVNVLSSQVAAHAPFGGVVPELASREHLKALPYLVEGVLGQAEEPIELVAVTTGPGLIGALLVGIRFAAAFAWGRSLPLVAVDHLEGHLVSPLLRLSAWYLMDEGARVRLGRTRDDAAGESFDKVAKVLGLGYPGGPVIDKLARDGDPTAIALPRARLKDAPQDFSFSGLKSAAIRWIRKNNLVNAGVVTPQTAVHDLAASFELAVVEQLLAPLGEMADTHRPQAVTASGGVAANTMLRRRLTQWGLENGIEVLLPEPALTTDNGAMVAHAGQLAHQQGRVDDPRRLDAHGRDIWQPPGMRRLSAAGGVE
jgi:N6-L-threonylcarbamoyladenine synthase